MKEEREREKKEQKSVTWDDINSVPSRLLGETCEGGLLLSQFLGPDTVRKANVKDGNLKFGCWWG